MAQADTRKLAAIMFTDMAGFQPPDGSDEARMCGCWLCTTNSSNMSSASITATLSRRWATPSWRTFLGSQRRAVRTAYSRPIPYL